MEAILKFKLPEERIEHLTATNATSLMSTIWELDQDLRTLEKNGEENISIEEIRSLIRDHLDNNGLGFNSEIFS